MLQKAWILMLVLALVGLMSWLPVSEGATEAPQVAQDKGSGCHGSCCQGPSAPIHLFLSPK